MKKIFSILITMVMVLCVQISAQAKPTSILVSHSGNVDMGISAETVTNETYCDTYITYKNLQDICQYKVCKMVGDKLVIVVDANVEYTIIIYKDSNKIQYQYDGNSISYAMSQPTRFLDGILYIPLNAFAEHASCFNRILKYEVNSEDNDTVDATIYENSYNDFVKDLMTYKTVTLFDGSTFEGYGYITAWDEFIPYDGKYIKNGLVQYEGKMSFGQANGWGKLYNNGILTYEGCLKYGIPCGYGIKYENGEKIEGIFEYGQLQE